MEISKYPKMSLDFNDIKTYLYISNGISNNELYDTKDSRLVNSKMLSLQRCAMAEPVERENLQQRVINIGLGFVKLGSSKLAKFQFYSIKDMFKSSTQNIQCRDCGWV